MEGVLFPQAGFPNPSVRHSRLDTLSSAEQIGAILYRERARADRTQTEFAVVLFEVETRRGRLRLMPAARLARALTRRARATDEIGWFDTRFICAVLPDTSAAGARRFADDVCHRLHGQIDRPVIHVYSYRPNCSDGSNGNGNGNGNGSNGDGSNGDGSNGDAGRLRRHVPSNGDGRNGDGHPRALREPATPSAGDADAPDLPSQLFSRPLPTWKRLLDVFGASTGLVLFSPVMLAVAALIKWSSPGPVLFKQRRAGQGGRPFIIYKFRTMTVDAEHRKVELQRHSEQDGPAFKMKRDPRVTFIGRFLRETSLDELPQLWNVLMGDMSLVGPRPLPCDEAAQCRPWQRQRLDILPGMTCTWQVAGRSRVTFDEWMRMDIDYIRNRRLARDLKLLLWTFPAVLFRRGY